ncbi:MAG: mevalonate kinase [Myxococcales bacterium FL481]|nr:MAG: mevalonate kinase [Myxococcales bacterium FL481]
MGTVSDRPTLHPVAEANGKIILVGEHAVVHGYPALAAAVEQRVRLSAEPSAARSTPIELRIPDWDVDLSLDPGDPHPIARASLEVLAASDGPVLGWSIRGTSDLPPRAGLGSSAALTVAMARLVLGPHAPVRSIVDVSLSGEAVFHGSPSGIDSQIAARGGVLRYIRGEEPTALRIVTPLRLVVAPTHIARSTADQVAKVQRKREQFPRCADATLRALADLVDPTETALLRHDTFGLGEIFTMAHHLLSALDVSHPRLDELCQLACNEGATGAKLTGAGGGGSLIAVVPDASAEDQVLHALRSTGAPAFATDIRGPAPT